MSYQQGRPIGEEHSVGAFFNFRKRGQDIFARRICMKNFFLNARIYIILARKIIKIVYHNFYDICPKRNNKFPEFYMIFARKMPDFYIIISRKIFFSIFLRGWGEHVRGCPSAPVSCAYGEEQERFGKKGLGLGGEDSTMNRLLSR